MNWRVCNKTETYFCEHEVLAETENTCWTKISTFSNFLKVCWNFPFSILRVSICSRRSLFLVKMRLNLDRACRQTIVQFHHNQSTSHCQIICNTHSIQSAFQHTHSLLRLLRNGSCSFCSAHFLSLFFHFLFPELDVFIQLCLKLFLLFDLRLTVICKWKECSLKTACDKTKGCDIGQGQHPLRPWSFSAYCKLNRFLIFITCSKPIRQTKRKQFKLMT